MLTRTIQALIFDCDGTLADTMPFHWQAWQVVTARHHVHFPEDRFYSLGGVPSREILKVLREEQNLHAPADSRPRLRITRAGTPAAMT